MATTESTHTRPPGDGPSPPVRVPIAALRTYTFLRLGVVAVIAVLAGSVAKEYAAADCLQGSLSAYYYMPVKLVFVGALVALGFTLIALWGKTPFEDGLMNLAGMLAPVVAFVPTTEARKCGLTDAEGQQVRTQAEEDAVIRAGHDAVTNNMVAYLTVIGIVLAAMLLIGIVAHRKQWASVVDHPVAYWLPWAGALALWGVGTYLFWQHRDDWFYDNAHNWSAIMLFGLIILAIIAIGVDRWRGNRRTGDAPSRVWAVTYWFLSGVMVLGAVTLFVAVEHDHRVFWVEAWLIGWLAVFWSLQTWDRWRDGAPPRTSAELRART